MDPAATSSRFVSESSLKEAQDRRKEEWRKAYERLGQEAPPDEAPPEKYDPRTLYEKLQEQKNAKQAAFEEKHSIRNEWRHTLEDDEADFISSVLNGQRSAEAERQAEIDAELAKFRQAVNAKQALIETSPPAASPPSASAPLNADPLAQHTSAGNSVSTSSTSSKPPIGPPKKKSGLQQKGLLAGAIKRKSSGGEKDSGKRRLSASTPGSSSAKPVTDTNAGKANKEPGNDIQNARKQSENSASHLHKKAKTESS